jgi:hypothetical protein
VEPCVNAVWYMYLLCSGGQDFVCHGRHTQSPYSVSKPPTPRRVMRSEEHTNVRTEQRKQRGQEMACDPPVRSLMSATSLGRKSRKPAPQRSLNQRADDLVAQGDPRNTVPVNMHCSCRNGVDPRDTVVKICSVCFVVTPRTFESSPLAYGGGCAWR